MKKFYLLLIVLILTLLLCSCKNNGAFQGDSTVDQAENPNNETTEQLKGSKGLEFTINPDGKGYSVIGIGSCGEKDVVIPSEYDGLPVTRIGNSAFCGTDITSAIIPNSVTQIDERAFPVLSTSEA